MQKPRGCHIEQDWNIGIITKKCPILFLEEYDLLFKLWGDYHKHGTYPNEGGYLKQSTKLHKVFSIISNQYQIFSEKQ